MLNVIRMKDKMLESDLRLMMKGLLGNSLEWFEPGRGIGSGHPDCHVLLPDKRRMPVELKLWLMKTKGLECDMRPAQIRYHYMNAHRKKDPTAIAYMTRLNEDEPWKVFLLNGRDVPQDRYKHYVVDKSIFLCSMPVEQKQKGYVRVKLINLLWGMK